MFARVENGVTKSCQFFRRKNSENRNLNFGLKISTFFSRIACSLLFARVEIGVTELPTKSAEEEEEQFCA